VSTERKFAVTMSGHWASIRVMQYVFSRRREPITKRRDVTPQKKEVIKIWIFDLGIRSIHDTRFVPHGGLVNNRMEINDYFAARLDSVCYWVLFVCWLNKHFDCSKSYLLTEGRLWFLFRRFFIKSRS